MKYSDNFKFNLPNKADGDSADIDPISENFRQIDEILNEMNNGASDGTSNYVVHETDYLSPTDSPTDLKFGTHICPIAQNYQGLPEVVEDNTIKGILKTSLFSDDVTTAKREWHPVGSLNVYYSVPFSEQNWSEWQVYSDGLSAYEIWLSQGNTGSEADFLESLQGEKGDTGATGATGADGYTPQKGVDYWTEADKAEIIASVINTLGGNPIFGYVDENNNIVVQGNLTDGTYSVKYEMENGTTVDIGELALGAKPKNFSVASEWTDNARLSISSGSTSTLAGHSTTNYIPCLKGDVIQVTGLNIVGLIAPNNNDSSNAAKIVVYDSNKSKIGGLYSVASSEAQNYGAKVAVDGDISTYTILLNNEGTQIATDSARYIRVDGGLLSGYTKNDVVINIKRNGEWLTE